MSAGIAALVGAVVLGRRTAHVEKVAHTPANIPYVLLGTGMLWFGWFGFNAGSSLAANETATLAFLNTNTASATAMLTWMFLECLRGKKASALGACIGAVVGLVAITPAAGFVSIGSAVLIGFFSSLASSFALSLKPKTEIDDTLDVFPCHGLGGIIGMILTGVFAKDVGLIAGETKTFYYHLIALLLVMAYCFGVSYILYWISNFTRPLRVSAEDESLGLDLSQHGEHI